MIERPKIFFRADGNHKVGHGHVIRSLALADMLKEEFECNFIIVEPSENLKSELSTICHSVIILTENSSLLDEAGYIEHQYLSDDAIIVLDGYNFETEYQRILKKSGCKIVCIDDIHDYHFLADVIINHAPGVSPMHYSVEPYTKLCLGLDYSLLRKPFLEAAKCFRDIKDINTLFVCFGGADFHNLTCKVLRGVLSDIAWLQRIIVVVGSSNKNLKELNLLVNDFSDIEVDVFSNLSAADMRSRMEEAHMAIVPASSILYEVLSVKMPVISGFYVDNQKDLYEGFKSLKAIYAVGDFREFKNYGDVFNQIRTNSINDTISRQGMFISSKSSARLKRTFNVLSGINGVDKIRKANNKDLIQYFNWANDTNVRENSFSPEKIEVEDHIKWFLEKLKDKSCFMYVFEIDDAPIGQVRFDISESIAQIDYSISELERGGGLGVRMLNQALERFVFEAKAFKVECIHGIVKLSNIGSIKTFEKLGFKRKKPVRIEGSECSLFVHPVAL